MGMSNPTFSIPDVAVRLALAKVEVSDQERAGVKPGEYPVDCWVKIQGILKVGEDTEAKQVNKIDWTGLFALALSKLNGVTAEALVEEFLALAEVDHDEIKKRAQKKIDEIKGTTKQPRKGAVKFSGTIQQTACDVFVSNPICIQVGNDVLVKG